MPLCQVYVGLVGTQDTVHARRALCELSNLFSSSFCCPTPFIHLGDKSIWWVYQCMCPHSCSDPSSFSLLSELHDLNFTHASLLHSREPCFFSVSQGMSDSKAFKSSLSVTPVKDVEDRRSSRIIGTLEGCFALKGRGGCDEHRYNTCRRHLDTGLLGEKFKLIGDWDICFAFTILNIVCLVPLTLLLLKALLSFNLRLWDLGDNTLLKTF